MKKSLSLIPPQYCVTLFLAAHQMPGPTTLLCMSPVYPTMVRNHGSEVDRWRHQHHRCAAYSDLSLHTQLAHGV